MSTNEFLPEPLPTDPLNIFKDWFHEAIEQGTSHSLNPDAMTLATMDKAGRPAARVVLCKQLEIPAGYVVFFTNYDSRKGRELDASGRAAAVFHWDALRRQVRIEGPVLHSPDLESDRYFASRPLDSRLSAWASAQSEPLASRAALAQQMRKAARRFTIAPGSGDAEIPRPPHWGGYRLWIDCLELWVEGPGRVHDRAQWRRALQPRDAFTFDAGPWQGTRLNP
ncbi:pyridoxamine 5'-phosphate oxidase [Steroidobacter denitrificans]|uniref:Pyridoxine/pyridoxamine 5'-phosphate oxidase n=1 Tax=Steroidobacter denitrificans TaxID=465721 RepID=A0A127F6Q0_STEDE|nr:pyridoxamine 5'-phosphate oxidase [Steroidobacter denitrificans]AMN46136.1 pyridoxamine 5'-phosphate oxidase [Steroidobacter denitrificans]